MSDPERIEDSAKQFKRNQVTNLRRSIDSAVCYLDLARMTAKSLGDNKLAKTLKKLGEELGTIRMDVNNRSDSHKG